MGSADRLMLWVGEVQALWGAAPWESGPALCACELRARAEVWKGACAARSPALGPLQKTERAWEGAQPLPLALWPAGGPPV